MNTNGFAEVYERACQEFEKMSFFEKLKLIKSTALLRYKYNFIKYNGYVAERTNFAIANGDDEYYVYLWKHIDGDIFYVGSGKGDRYKNKNRNDEFLRHIDKGDAVVYIVLCGVDSKTARFYERYLSGSFGMADYGLSNGDNNIIHIDKDKFERWLDDNKSKLDNELTRKIENTILNGILLDKDFRADHFYSIQFFREECGDTYFSGGGFRTYPRTEVG